MPTSETGVRIRPRVLQRIEGLEDGQHVTILLGAGSVIRPSRWAHFGDRWQQAFNEPIPPLCRVVQHPDEIGLDAAHDADNRLRDKHRPPALAIDLQRLRGPNDRYCCRSEPLPPLY